MWTPLLWLISNFCLAASANFIGIQCGDKVCGKNAICEDGLTNDDEEVSPKCICSEGHIGLPHEACFKTCLAASDCSGVRNECVYHDAYFPQYENISFFMYNYPYSHHRCLYDCTEDSDCGKNAICKRKFPDKISGDQKLCACSKGYVGLPYLQCFDPDPKSFSLTGEQDEPVKCPRLEKTEGLKISCLDRDGTEHDCSTGGIPGTSAMYSCRAEFLPTNFRIKYSRMKCGSSGKWSQYKMFHCRRSAKVHSFLGALASDADYV